MRHIVLGLSAVVFIAGCDPTPQPEFNVLPDDIVTAETIAEPMTVSFRGQHCQRVPGAGLHGATYLCFDFPATRKPGVPHTVDIGILKERAFLSIGQAEVTFSGEGNSFRAIAPIVRANGAAVAWTFKGDPTVHVWHEDGVRRVSDERYRDETRLRLTARGTLLN